MELTQVVLLAAQLSIICIVFGFGLKATFGDLLYLFRRPGLLARSLLSMFVVMPVVAVLLASVLDEGTVARITLVALAISPVPPILPNKETKAGGNASFGIGLMAILSILSIALIPLALKLLELIFNRQLGIDPATIAAIAFKATLLPLVAGMIVRALAPALAHRLERPVSLFSLAMLSLVGVVLIVGALPAILALIGDGTVVAIVVFVVVGLAAGHVLGGPDPDQSVVLALSTACRHPAIAFALASSNFPDRQFGAPLLLYLLLSTIVGMPYLAWRRKQMAGALRTA